MCVCVLCCDSECWCLCCTTKTETQARVCISLISCWLRPPHSCNRSAPCYVLHQLPLMGPCSGSTGIWSQEGSKRASVRCSLLNQNSCLFVALEWVPHILQGAAPLLQNATCYLMSFGGAIRWILLPFDRAKWQYLLYRDETLFILFYFFFSLVSVLYQMGQCHMKPPDLFHISIRKRTQRKRI